MRAMPRARHAGDKKTAYSSRIVRVNESCMVSMGKWPVPGSVCSGICPSIMSPVHRSGGPQVIGAAHIGWPNPDVAIISAQPGRDQLPVKFYYNHLPKFVWEVTVPAGSAVRGIADLKGKKIGVSRLSSGAIPILQAILYGAGLKQKDVELIPVGFGGPASRAITKGQVDSLFLFDIMHKNMKIFWAMVSCSTRIRSSPGGEP